MKRFAFVLLTLLSVTLSPAQSVLPPDKIYGALFTDVQLSRIFPDNKTFVDCIPKRDPQAILQDYKAVKNNPAVRFSLQRFVEENFIIPQAPQSDYQSKEKDVVKHIENLWTVLKRKSDSAIKGSSLLPLPYPYIVPGGRFREIYYWDSYFTMLGLKESGEAGVIEDMIKNFAYLIQTYGHIPNGNRSYYLSRSQPPFFALMVDLLAGIKGSSVYTTYKNELKQEYDYWMDRTAPTLHVVKMPDGSILNRYYDQSIVPRQESYYEDYTLTQNKPTILRDRMRRDLRSCAESGWDFSSRWFRDGKTLATIQTTNLVAVDLNCLLLHLEKVLAKAAMEAGRLDSAILYLQKADQRRKAINKYCWSANGWYTDYNIETGKSSLIFTLAGMYPFFLHVADEARMKQARHVLENLFVKPGGVVTTPNNTGEQWDAPNGWAPLEWVTITGLENYGQSDLARTLAERWIRLNVDVYNRTGKLMEKYNVLNTTLEAGGGEYPSQDGFGWTNGVLLALMKKYGTGKREDR
ncbi:MAG: alpha,alpha-trehalase TreA [Flavisolibacter sp.]|nr:alpha,alpha-trehalase TreA [Flavisolibacter sp.]